MGTTNLEFPSSIVPVMKLIKTLIAAVNAGLFSVLLIVPNPVLAQVAVTPLIVESVAQRGQAKGVITLSNPSDKVYRGRIYTKPFTYTREGFSPVESSPSDLTPYLTFSPKEVVLQPGQSRQIRFVSRMLPSTPTGEYRAVVFVEELKPSVTTETFSVNLRFGVTVYVRQGETAPKLAVQTASYDSQRQQIALLVGNSGNASARPKAEWRLQQNGKVIAQGISEEYTVIANGDRDVKISPQGDQPLSPGNYQLTGNLVWDVNLPNIQPKSQPFNINLTVPVSTAVQSGF